MSREGPIGKMFKAFITLCCKFWAQQRLKNEGSKISHDNPKTSRELTRQLVVLLNCCEVCEALRSGASSRGIAGRRMPAHAASRAWPHCTRRHCLCL